MVSAQSPFQKWLIENHPDNVPIYIEGKFTVWLRTASINYFIMRSDVNLNRKRRQWGDIDGNYRIFFLFLINQYLFSII